MTENNARVLQRVVANDRKFHYSVTADPDIERKYDFCKR